MVTQFLRNFFVEPPTLIVLGKFVTRFRIKTEWTSPSKVNDRLRMDVLIYCTIAVYFLQSKFASFSLSIAVLWRFSCRLTTFILAAFRTPAGRTDGGPAGIPGKGAFGLGGTPVDGMTTIFSGWKFHSEFGSANVALDW